MLAARLDQALAASPTLAPGEALRSVLAANPDLRPPRALLADGNGMVIAAEPPLAAGAPLELAARRSRAADHSRRQGRRAAGAGRQRRRRIRRRPQPPRRAGSDRFRLADRRVVAPLAALGADHDPPAGRRLFRADRLDQRLRPASAPRPGAGPRRSDDARPYRSGAEPRPLRPVELGPRARAASPGRSRCSRCSACRRAPACCRSPNCRR